jgi:hypothetical protein
VISRAIKRRSNPFALPAALAVVAVALVLGGALVSARMGLGSSQPSAASNPVSDFNVRIQEGLSVKWNPVDAAAQTLELIKGDERLLGRALAEPRILSVEAYAGEDIPFEIGEGNLGEWPVVWVVRAQGTFVAFSCPVAAKPCPSGSSGFYAFDDDGMVIGDGFDE